MLALMACRRQRRLATRAYVCQQIREFRSTTKRVQKGIAFEEGQTRHERGSA